MTAVLSKLVSEKFNKVTGIEVLPLEAFCNLDAPVSSHADMLLCVIEKNVFCYEKYCLENARIFDKISSLGYNVIKVKKPCAKEYPGDIALNVLIMGKTLFCNIKNTAVEIINFAKSNGYKIVNVKQGYSACSTLILDERHAISADPSIISAIKREGKKVLESSPEGISLDGYGCGFIGGASGVSGKKVYFFGDYKSHPSHAEIDAFLNKNGFEPIKILDTKLCDFGGIKFLL